jgi:hypothetical protein
MHSIRKFLLVFILALMPLMASAAMWVNSLNYPVWIERGSNTLPLAPGDRLQDGDIVQTGATGRVWLEVEDGSVIKLGRDTRFSIDRVDFREVDNVSVFEAAFDVMKGAFRFTRGFFSVQQPATHRVEFQVGAISANIQGTDVWGRSGEHEDIVALFEGRVEVTSAGQDPVVMDQAMTLFRKANSEPDAPVAVVDAVVVESLTSETELDASAGIARAGGVYSLVLQSNSNPAHADAALKRFHDAGYAVLARLVEVSGKFYTRIQLSGLIHLESANNLRQAMISEGLIDDAWIVPFE